jgi:hypothetical protein
MTTRAGYVEYPFDIRTATLADATRHDFAAITITLPETSGRVFRSVWVELYAMDAQAATATRAALSAWTLGIKLGAAAFSDTTNTPGAALTDTGEQTSIYMRGPEWAAYFTSNFGSGATQTCQVGVQFATSSATNPVIWANISAKICIRYDYDDAGQDTYLTHAEIPLESPAGALTGTLAEIGTNQVPLLNTFCPEGSKSFKAIWFEIEAFDANSTTTDYQLGVRLDSATEVTFGSVECACDSARKVVYFWRQDSLDTSAAHAFSARYLTGTATHNHLRITLHVVYTWSLAASSRMLVSTRHLLGQAPTMVGSTSGHYDRRTLQWYPPEPGTLTLLQSAAVVRWGRSLLRDISVCAGGQTARSYTPGLGTLSVGDVVLQHRIDSGGAAGVGLTLAASGTVTALVVDVASVDGVGNHFAPSYEAVVNYSCDIPALGPGAASRTLRALMIAGHVSGGGYSIIASDVAIATLPATWHCHGAGIELAGSAQHIDFGLSRVGTNRAAGETPAVSDGQGTVWLWEYDLRGTNERICFTPSAGSQRIWRRGASDLDTSRMSPVAVRDWIGYGAAAARFVAGLVVASFQPFRFDVEITNSAGGTVTLRLCDAATGEALVSTTRVGNGSATLEWGDPRPCYVDAYEDGTHMGRSDAVSGTRVTS